MRTWRKLHHGIINSERLASVSDSARWLFALLIVAQDDEGKYPWTPTKLAALTVGTAWTRADTDSLASQLRDAGLVTLGSGCICIVDGAAKNGTPANSKSYPLLYDIVSEPYDESIPTQHRLEADSSATRKIRVDKSREDKRREASPIAPLKTSPWISILKKLPGWKEDVSLDAGLVKWATLNSFSDETMESIADAMLARVKPGKYRDLRAAARSWARNASRWEGQRNGKHSSDTGESEAQPIYGVLNRRA
jgi:hypothetical protein